MNTQKLTTSFFGHKVEVTLVTADDGDKCYASIPNSVVDHFSERMECGEREGSFENLPDDELNSGADGFALSGHWRIIEIDYRKIVRILTWKGECASHEALTEESFSATSVMRREIVIIKNGKVAFGSTYVGCWPVSKATTRTVNAFAI